MSIRALALALAVLVAPSVAADPFGVLDLQDIAPAGEMFGPVTLADGTILYHAEGELALCDPARGRNLAELVIELQMAHTVLRACPGLSNPHRLTRLSDMRALALPRYAERLGLPDGDVARAFHARVAAEVALVGRCGVVANSIASDVADDWFETRLREAMTPDRRPARSCPETFE